jgi:hypothetical protein
MNAAKVCLQGDVGFGDYTTTGFKPVSDVISNQLDTRMSGAPGSQALDAFGTGTSLMRTCSLPSNFDANCAFISASVAFGSDQKEGLVMHSQDMQPRMLDPRSFLGNPQVGLRRTSSAPGTAAVPSAPLRVPTQNGDLPIDKGAVSGTLGFINNEGDAAGASSTAGSANKLQASQAGMPESCLSLIPLLSSRPYDEYTLTGKLGFVRPKDSRDITMVPQNSAVRASLETFQASRRGVCAKGFSGIVVDGYHLKGTLGFAGSSSVQEPAPSTCVAASGAASTDCAESNVQGALHSADYSDALHEEIVYASASMQSGMKP